MSPITIRRMDLISARYCYCYCLNLIQTFYYFSRSCGLVEKCNIDDLELMCTIVAGSCHDHEHPGLNNVYLVETKDPIAIRHNGTIFLFHFIQTYLYWKTIIQHHHLQLCKKQIITYFLLYLRKITRELDNFGSIVFLALTCLSTLVILANSKQDQQLQTTILKPQIKISQQAFCFILQISQILQNHGRSAKNGLTSFLLNFSIREILKEIKEELLAT